MCLLFLHYGKPRWPVHPFRMLAIHTDQGKTGQIVDICNVRIFLQILGGADWKYRFTKEKARIISLPMSIPAQNAERDVLSEAFFVIIRGEKFDFKVVV